MKLWMFVFLLGSAITISAAQPEQQLILTKPARVPGIKLKAGTYTIRVIDSLTDRFILQVTDESRSHLLSTFLAIPDENLPHPGEGRPSYWSTRGHDAVIRGMWIEGVPTGMTFVFEKEEAAKLAKQVLEPIPAVDPDSEGIKPLAKMSGADRQIVTLWLLSAVAVTPDGKQTGIQAAKFVPTAQAAKKLDQTSPPSANLVARAKSVKQDEPTGGERVTRMPTTAGNFAGDLMLGAACLLFGTGCLFVSRKYVV